MLTEEFYPELGQLFPSAPWLAFDRALGIAARTLCRRGLVWRVDLDPMNWVAGQSEYDLTPPFDTDVVQVLSIPDLTPSTPQQLATRARDWQTAEGTPTWFYLPRPNVMRVAPIPQAPRAEDFTVHVALSPRGPICEIDDAYALRFERLLFHGAVANLAGRGWPEFEAECDAARSVATDGQHIGVPRRVRYGGY